MVDGTAPAVGGNSPLGAELEHRHTSDLLEDLVSQAPDGPVDLDWLLGHLDKRSFGLLLLLLGLLVIVLGVATAAALAILFPAVEMMLGRSRPTFPGFLASWPSGRSISSVSKGSRRRPGRRSARSRTSAGRGGRCRMPQPIAWLA
jgi:hypothetical protein